VLADNVSACQIVYDVPNARFGLVAVRLTLTSENESVSLYNEIHVNNAP
jgi:MSHA biogenesis protein MshO